MLQHCFSVKLASAGCIVLFYGFGISPVRAQRTDTILGPPSCSNCRVKFDVVANLGALTDPASPTLNSLVARRFNGEFLIAPVTSTGQLFVYSAAGKFLRAIGRAGQGPGEFGSSIRFSIGPKDTLHVFDGTLRRWSILSPQGVFHKNIPLPGLIRDVELLSNGSAAIHALLRDEATFAKPLHIVDRNGRLIASFPEDRQVSTQQDEFRILTVMNAANKGAFWSARMAAYEAYLRNEAGEVISKVIRRTPWFSSESKPVKVREKPSEPFVIGLWEGTDGYLWVLTAVADRDWRPDPNGPQRVTPGSRAKHYDTMIEAIDLSTRRVVVAARFDRWLQPVRNTSDLVYEIVEDPSGNYFARVWRVSIK